MLIDWKHWLPYPDPEFINLVLDHRKAAEDFYRLSQTVAQAELQDHSSSGHGIDLTALQSQLEAADKALWKLALRPSKPARRIPEPSLN
jgi:hypothetical protein